MKAVIIFLAISISSYAQITSSKKQVMIGDTLSLVMSVGDYTLLKNDSQLIKWKGDWQQREDRGRIIYTIQPFEYGGYAVDAQGIRRTESNPLFFVDTPKVDMKGDIKDIIYAKQPFTFPWWLLIIPFILACITAYFYFKNRRSLMYEIKKMLNLARKTSEPEVQIEYIDRAFKYYMKRKWDCDLYSQSIPELLDTCKNLPQLKNDIPIIEKFYKKIEGIKYAQRTPSDMNQDIDDFLRIMIELEKKKDS